MSLFRSSPEIRHSYFTVYWKIKNFSYCRENISSPDFTFYETKWCLQLQTKNSSDVICEIVKLDGSKCLFLSSISFLTCDGSQNLSNESRTSLSAPKDTLFGKRRSSFLPKDTLTIRFKLEDDRVTGNVLIQSQIGVKRKTFLWNINVYNSAYGNNKLVVENSDEYGEIQLSPKSTGGTNFDEQFYIDISRGSGEKCYSVLKVSILDNDGKVLNHVSDGFIFEKENRKQVWRFPPIIKRSKLLAYKNLIQSNGTQSLKCDFCITLGKVSDQTAVYSYKEDIIPLLTDSDDISTYFEENSCSTDLKSDLKTILDNGTFCDVRLQVGPDVIPAHKIILSARSPVFKAMFSKDMKETIKNTVDIEDLDVETVRSLLLYMYSDTISVYQWENITKLYFAADKYEILGLKQKCSDFLKTKLSFSSVCEILVLADLHQDADLKSVALDYFSKYESEILASDTWKELEQNNSPLALKTLRDICSNKRLD